MSIKHLLSTLSLALVFAAAQANANLVITGVFDGPLDGGEPKVVELFALTDVPDLSLYNASSANNGGGSDGPESTLSGSASAGDFIYIVDDNSDSALGVEFAEYFGFTPALLFDSNLGANGGAAAINGDDAVELFFDPTGAFAGAQTVIDTFGEITHAGPGAWNYLDGWAYRNDFTGPDGSTFVIGNWTFSGVDAADGTTTNAGSNNPFPIGTYQPIPEPATCLLAGVALIGVLAVRKQR
jgi:PEP-CTERM motif